MHGSRVRSLLGVDGRVTLPAERARLLQAFRARW
jgi:hypothetical protein